MRRPGLTTILRLIPWLGAAGWAVFLIAGSLTPFDFHFDRLGVRVMALTMEKAPMHDLAVNLPLYVPLAVALRLAGRRWWTTAIVVVGLCYGLECTQRIIPDRVGSWYDVAHNVLPALIAIVVTPWCVAAWRWLCNLGGQLGKLNVRQIEPALGAA